MINEALIRTKIDAIQVDLGRLTEYAVLSFDESGSVDMAAPLDYRETFIKLGEFGVLSQPFAERIAKSAGFRNAIVHGYNNLDKQLVFTTIGEAIGQYTKYCGYLLAYLKKSN